MKHLTPIRLLIICSLLLLGAGRTSAQSIRLESKVGTGLEIGKSTVTIGDLFRVLGGSEKVQQKIKALPVLNLRRPGITQNLYDYQVEQELAQQGFDRSVKIGGTFPIAIHAEEAQISPHYLADQISAFFKKDFQETIQWSYVRDPALPVFPGEPYQVQFRRPNHVLPGRFALQGILNNGSSTRPFSILLEIKVLKQVLVATEHITPGTLLNSRNTRLEKRSLKPYEVRNALTNTSGAGEATMETIRDIAPGEVILATQIKKMALIQPGDPVTMVVEYGRIQVKSQGRAIESGGLHDKIRVRDDQSGKVVVGTLENNHTVKLEVRNTL
ncbi:MAG: flagellar basal body P-ring formation chaperone FlgA [Calditrichota bacterium]